MDMYMGTIIAWPIHYAPQGWMFCQGQLLPIAQYTALYSLIGTTYGGDGRTTFALPDLRGCVPVGAGQAPGLSNYQMGQRGGEEKVTLTADQMPMHTHAQPASTKTATVGQPGPSAVPGAYEKERGVYYNIYSPQADANTTLAPDIGTGGSRPHNNMQPYIALNYHYLCPGLISSPGLGGGQWEPRSLEGGRKRGWHRAQGKGTGCPCVRSNPRTNLLSSTSSPVAARIWNG